MNKELTKAIEEMHRVDQSLRQMATGPEVKLENYLVYLADQVHNARLHRLIEEHGHPKLSNVGPETMKQFWLLIQHQDGDINLQSECLNKCDFEPTQQAYLTDRVRVNSGEPQLYGTQLKRDKDGKLTPQPIKDEVNVDDRRREVGLGLLEEYINRSNE